MCVERSLAWMGGVLCGSFSVSLLSFLPQHLRRKSAPRRHQLIIATTHHQRAASALHYIDGRVGFSPCSRYFLNASAFLSVCLERNSAAAAEQRHENIHTFLHCTCSTLLVSVHLCRMLAKLALFFLRDAGVSIIALVAVTSLCFRQPLFSTR